MNEKYLDKKRIIKIVEYIIRFVGIVMVNIKVLQQENKHWHEDHLLWINEVKQWQHETRRLLALLYLLERSLPEHSSILNKHAALIQKHEQQINSYESGLDDLANSSCSDFIIEQQQQKFHHTISKLHEKSQQDHLALKSTYSNEMDRFKSLVLKLLNEC